jgi:hypothetical protein
MNRQGVDGVDGRESPALASGPHPSPRPRVARRGGAHAPPKGVLAGLVLELLEPKWFERRSGSLKPRATKHSTL